MSSSTRMTAIIGDWVEKAVAKYALGDRFTWDMTFTLTEEGPKVLLVFFLPGAVIGTQLQSVVGIDAPGQAAERDLVEVVRTAFGHLRQGRSAQMGLAPPPGQGGDNIVTNGKRV